jgi:hypothetical protein
LFLGEKVVFYYLLYRRIGTVTYIAPEQFKGDLLLWERSYAFSMMVYEWLICLRPFFLKWEEMSSHEYDTPSSKSRPMTLQQNRGLAFKESYEPDQSLE